MGEWAMTSRMVTGACLVWQGEMVRSHHRLPLLVCRGRGRGHRLVNRVCVVALHATRTTHAVQAQAQVHTPAPPSSTTTSPFPVALPRPRPLALPQSSPPSSPASTWLLAGSTPHHPSTNTTHATHTHTSAGTSPSTAHSASAAEVGRMCEEALDALYGLGVPLPYEVVAGLLAGMDAILRRRV